MSGRAEQSIRRRHGCGMIDCVEWQGSKSKNGYGVWKKSGPDHYVHRSIWRKSFGEIPKGFYICHSCNNKACCNINHLYLATPKGNSSDAIRDGLYKTRELHGRAKLTWNNISEIRNNSKAETQQCLADRFGVCQTTISRILLHEIWKQ